jgi:hypothetical protein
MKSQLHGLEDIQKRLLRLEKQNRRLKQLGAAVLILSASVIGMGQMPSKKTVEANEFILRDDGGNIRARLFMTEKTTGTIQGWRSEGLWVRLPRIYRIETAPI